MMNFKPAPTDVALLGEVMIELSTHGADQAKLGVAGDTYNTAVALAQLGQSAKYFTALGDCAFSQRIKTAIDDWQVDGSVIVTNPSATPGLYAIVNDDVGERSFSYWRDNSAAKQWLSSRSAFEQILPTLQQSSVVYWSGITLALMSQSVRERFFDWLAVYRSEGGVVCFDSNYRPKLWAAEDDMRTTYESAIAVADMYLPSIEDGQAIHGKFTTEVAKGFIQQFGLQHVVITNDDKATWLSQEQVSDIPLTFASSIQDATGAGDAFSGGLLAALLQGAPMPQAINFAHEVASAVVQTQGAILPKKVWRDLKQTLAKASFAQGGDQ